MPSHVACPFSSSRRADARHALSSSDICPPDTCAERFALTSVGSHQPDEQTRACARFMTSPNLSLCSSQRRRALPRSPTCGGPKRNTGWPVRHSMGHHRIALMLREPSGRLAARWSRAWFGRPSGMPAEVPLRSLPPGKAAVRLRKRGDVDDKQQRRRPAAAATPRASATPRVEPFLARIRGACSAQARLSRRSGVVELDLTFAGDRATSSPRPTDSAT
jgi:hypothetical protein